MNGHQQFYWMRALQEPTIPPMRSERADWHALSDQEQHEVGDYLTGQRVTTACSVRVQAYLRRHVSE